jgi:hypothetical protein|nr:hypothetical protein [uncultured Brevundimonas sp.]
MEFLAHEMNAPVVLEQIRSAEIASFLQELTSIANKYGVGINDDAELFVMSGEDFEFRYSLDKNGRLSRL